MKTCLNICNKQPIRIMIHPLGQIQIHGKFKKPIEIQTHETVKNSFEIQYIKGIPIQLYKTGFQILSISDDQFKDLGYVIHRITTLRRRLKDRVIDDMIDSESILLRRKR